MTVGSDDRAAEIIPRQGTGRVALGYLIIGCALGLLGAVAGTSPAYWAFVGTVLVIGAAAIWASAGKRRYVYGAYWAVGLALITGAAAHQFLLRAGAGLLAAFGIGTTFVLIFVLPGIWKRFRMFVDHQFSGRGSPGRTIIAIAAAMAIAGGMLGANLSDLIGRAGAFIVAGLLLWLIGIFFVSIAAHLYWKYRVSG